MKYILVNGYTATGSSAVVDYLKEFDCTFVPDDEFRLLCDPHGIIDLDREINNSVDSLNDDIAIRNFIWFTNKYFKNGNGFRAFGLNYENMYTHNIRLATDNYIEKLTQYDYQGYWWYLSLDMPYVKQLFFKTLKKLKLYDFRKHYRMRLVTVDEKEFLKLTKDYINDIFAPICHDKELVVLDQAIPANHPGYGDRYFESSKVINVERDARDVYIHLITQEKRDGAIIGHIGLELNRNRNVEMFVEWYKKYRRPGLKGDSLNIYFEDIVFNYEDTTRIVMDYLGLNDAQHVYKKKYLQVEKSKKNIGLWKSYENQDEIRQIEKALPEYCYNEKFLK